MGEQAERIVEVGLAELLVDPRLQPRLDGLAPGHVAALAEDAEAWPPLTVVERDGRYVLVDGFHRLAAAERLGIRAVRIAAVEPPADGDLRSLAFSLNALHGRPLSLADRKAEVLRLLRRDPASSSRSLARQCGLSHVTVERLRAEAVASGQVDHLDLREGEGGYTYRAPVRQPGELPPEGLGEAIGRGIAGLADGREASQRRRLASYLERVAEALDDQFRLPDWSAEALAAAACARLGEEELPPLGARLGRGALNLLAVARLLGYEPGPEEA